MALLVFPFMMYNLSFDMDYICFSMNAVLCWYYIKQIEKLYYKKYDKLSSMLYNMSIISLPAIIDIGCSSSIISLYA